VPDVPASAGADGGRSKRGRLSRSAEFERVYRQGRSYGNRFLVLWMFPRGEEPRSEPATPDPEPRLGITVTRAVGGAVERNRMKRLLREAFAAEKERLPPSVDVVVQARPSAGELAEREGVVGIRRELGELIGRVEAEGAQR
jgi:ribonuclease P protein component